MSQEKAVVIYSGGMDSFTLLNQLKHMHPTMALYPLTFDYGQRHRTEIDYAKRVCQQLGLVHKVVDISSISQLMDASSLMGNGDIPQGHYEDSTMKSTVVPNRNMVLLSLAIAYAVNLGAQRVYYGAHGGDHAIYPDCRPEFVARMNAVSQIANYEPVEVCTPYLHMKKDQILSIGLQLGLNYGDSWTCYNGGNQACGKCGSCVERLEAFRLNDATDPLPYITNGVNT